MQELSIIFQGKYTNKNGGICKKVLSNLIQTRKLFPLAEIILSTWKNSYEVEKSLRSYLICLDIRLVTNSDPGPLMCQDRAGKYLTNVNRMILSSREGLKASTRLLSIKLRTDTTLYGRKIINLLENDVLNDSHPVRRDLNFKIFKSRVINCNLFARDARGSLPYLYHPGDIMLAGYTEDLVLFFSAPLANEKMFNPNQMSGLWCAWRYVPEQWCWLNAIFNKTGRWVYDGNFSYTNENISNSEQWFLANFIPYSKQTLNVRWSKLWRKYPFRGFFSTYTYNSWLMLAAKYQGVSVTSSRRIRFFIRSIFIQLWRIGYRFRRLLINNDIIRSLAIHLFVHRQ